MMKRMTVWLMFLVVHASILDAADKEKDFKLDWWRFADVKTAPSLEWVHASLLR